MWKDPIVEEIHSVREEIARKFNYDMGEIIADLRKRQEEHPERVVRKGDLQRRKAAIKDPSPTTETERDGST